ncbi:glycosyltransferase WbuB [Clostridium sp. HMb25]|nr:glycosyltransferase WbuB [Clostridium sp. HMb25]
MHLLVISQYFYPEEFRINDMCREWVKRGYKVTVVTGIPNYPKGTFYNGYGLLKKRSETYEGIEIIRLPIIPRGKRSIQLILNYFSFVLSGMVWQWFTRIKADYVFIFEVSPMTQALPGIWYAKKKKIPCYLYVQDLWPENVEIVTGIHSPLVIGPIGKMVDYIYKRCSRIFVTSQSFKNAIELRGIEKKKVIYWPQYAEDFYVPYEKAKYDDTFRLIFTGNIGYAQGLDILPQTALLLKKENIKFILVGDGRYKNELMKEIKQLDVEDMFQMIGRQPATKIPQLLSKADAAFFSFMDNPLFEMTIPAKLQSYMACGMPIVAAVSGESREIIEVAECGICSPIGDAGKLAEAIRKMKESDLVKLGKNSQLYVQKYFSKEKLLNKIDCYFGGKYV